MRKRGQELVEFALVLPLLLLVVLGGLGAASAISSSTQVNQGASRAALDAANSNSDSGGCRAAFFVAQTAIKEVVTSSLTSNIQITVNCDADNSNSVCSGDLATTNPCPLTVPFAAGGTLTVKVDAQVSLALFGLGPSLPVSSTAASIIPRSP